MTEHSEIRIPLIEMRLAIECAECHAEVIVDPSNEKQRARIENKTQMKCAVCHAEFPRATIEALDDFGKAASRGVAGQQITLTARRPAS